MKPLVIIRCAAYNHEPYIRQCLDGFVMQKTNFPFYEVVHEDASIDGTQAILTEYAEKYPDIIRPIYEEVNVYQTNKPRFCEIMDKACQGAKYVAMCEGDDYWFDPYKLQKQVDYMESHPDCSCYAHNSLILNTQTRAIGLFNKQLLDVQDYPLETFFAPGWFTPTQSLLYRQSDYQLFDDMPRFMHGDYSLLVNVLLKRGTYLHYDNQIMSVYRDGGWASSHYKELDLFNDFIALLEYYKEKSNHRCDAVFDEQILIQQRDKEQYLKRIKDESKTPSLYKRIKRWLRKQMK